MSKLAWRAFAPLLAILLHPLYAVRERLECSGSFRNNQPSEAGQRLATKACPPHRHQRLPPHGFPSLAGCRNDVEIVRQFLIGKYDLEPENIRTLLDSQATRAAIIRAFQEHLIAKTDSNDVVVFYYSGYGSQVKDRSGDEFDSKDETIVPYDSRQGNVFDLTDDEINNLLQRVSQKTLNLTFIFDSCNSGTLSRGSGQSRSIPEDLRLRASQPASSLRMHDASFPRSL